MSVVTVDHVSVETSTGEKLADCQLVLSQTEVSQVRCTAVYRARPL